MKDYIAYSGTYFVIEWFFDSAGKSDVIDYYNALDDSQKRKTMLLFKKMGDFGIIFDKTNKI